MQQPGNDLLAGTGRPGDEHAAAGRGDALERLANGGNRRRRAEQLHFAAQPGPQLFVLPLEAGLVEHLAHPHQQVVGLERLLDVVVGAQLHRGERRLVVAVAADHHDRQSRVIAPDDFEQLQAVELAALQPDIENDETRPPLGDCLQGRLAVGSLSCLIVFVRQNAADEHSNIGFIIDDEDLSRHAHAPVVTPSCRLQARSRRGNGGRSRGRRRRRRDGRPIAATHRGPQRSS
jgi:hypothetical protein